MRSPSTLTRDGEQVLNFDSYLLHLLSTFSNRVKAISSSQYLSQYELGSVEMRIIASLAFRPQQKAAEVCELISVDKGAASRAINRLEKRGLVTSDSPSGRQKRWILNDAGWQLHRDFLQLVLAREAELYAGISDAELSQFHLTLNKLSHNLALLEQSIELVKGVTDAN
mgnify:CR=1 FL=1